MVTTRAVVLVGGPAAPYSRSVRIARALAAEGFAVEIAAVTAPGLPDREVVGPGRAGAAGEPEPGIENHPPIELRRYAPSGPWRFVGASDAASGARAEVGSTTAPRGGLIRQLASPLLDLRRWLLWPHPVRGWWATLARDLAPADVYHACGSLTIAAALAARDRYPVGPSGRPARVIYDSVDIVTESNAVTAMPPRVRRRIARIEAAWATAADRIVTINDAFAERLTAMWRPEELIAVLPNIPEPPDPGELEAGANLLRRAAGLPPSTRIVVFQGRTGPNLGLEAAAEAITQVPDAALVILGFGRGMAAARARDRDARFEGRHVTLDARPADEVVAWVASADVCLIPLPPVSANQRLTTPNKFWEAVVAGTPIVVPAGLTTMASLVRDHDLGAVAASAEPQDLAAAITSVLDRLATPDGAAWRARIRRLADEQFGWPPAASAYRSLVRSLLGAPPNDGGSTAQSS
ncbi:MAG TPA: glycosyltransferase [Candidatus Limnocylindrales bacterium]|nr:glycosyltransferase [Candidatus Limnocylindrales bacterium]